MVKDKHQVWLDCEVINFFHVCIYSFAGVTTGISLLLDARNTKIHVQIKQLLDKIVVSTQLL